MVQPGPSSRADYNGLLSFSALQTFLQWFCFYGSSTWLCTWVLCFSSGQLVDIYNVPIHSFHYAGAYKLHWLLPGILSCSSKHASTPIMTLPSCSWSYSPSGSWYRASTLPHHRHTCFQPQHLPWQHASKLHLSY